MCGGLDAVSIVHGAVRDGVCVFLVFLTARQSDFYRILEVPRNASQDDIKKVSVLQ